MSEINKSEDNTYQENKTQDYYCQINDPELLTINHNGVSCYGADQAWYSQYIQRYSGCGPTVCSNIFMYYIQSEKMEFVSCGCDFSRSKDIYKLMDVIWKYVTPGNLGVNSTTMFKEGVLDFAEYFDIPMSIDTLDVHASKLKRPEYTEVKEFIEESLSIDCPVAFLNLSNGNQNNLESWHWVLITGIKDEMATIFDQGKKIHINLKDWLESTLMGGGFVTIQVNGS